MKRLLTRQSYLNDLKLNHYSKYTGVNSINEEAPFANDLPWGDTHIGRLINSFARKAKIAFNKRRISGLTNRLKSIFDEMIEIGSIEVSSEGNSILFLQISTLLGELESQVKDGEDVKVLILTTEDLIEHIRRYEYADKDKMIKALEDFLGYLKGLSSGKSDSDKDDELKKGVVKFEEKYLVCKSFLQSVVSLHDDIKLNVVRFKDKEYGKDVNLKTHFDISKFNEIKSKFEKSSPKDKLGILRQLVQMCEDGLDAYKAKGDKANINLFNKYFKDYSGLLIDMERKQRGNTITQQESKPKVSQKPGETVGKKQDVKQLASYSFQLNEEANPSTGLANVEGGESHAKNAWKKVINAYNQSKISTFIPQIQELLNTTSKGDKQNLLNAKENIVKICKQCVLNYSTVGKPIKFEDLIKEAVNVNDVSKSISLMGRILLAYKEDLGLVGSYGKAAEPIKNFVNGFTKLQKIFESEKVEVKKESILKNYDKFLLIVEKNQYSEQITEKFNEIFTPEVVEYFNVTDAKKSDLEKNIKERESGELVFTSADPIIEIVRLFNRAWRIHTPGVIPSGRTGGKVSNSVFREYEDLGSGSGTPDNPGSGPYRNIELYDQWFESVQDILSDTKYRPIFSEKAVFRFVNEETGQEGDVVEKGGKTLLKFINELLSDSKMYKKGAMNNFIDEYFKLDEKDVNKLGGINYANFGDSKDNQTTSESIVESEVLYKPLDQVKNLTGGDLHKIFTGPNSSDFENLSFRVKMKSGDKEADIYYFTYLKTESGFPILVFSKLNYPFDLTKVKGKDIQKNLYPLHVHLGSLPNNGSFKNGSKANLKFIDISKDVVKQDMVSDRVEFIIEKVDILCKSDSGDPYLDFSNYLPRFKKNVSSNIKNATSYIKTN